MVNTGRAHRPAETRERCRSPRGLLLRTAAAFVVRATGVCVLTAAALSGCDESLPPREEPPDTLQANFHPIEGTVIVRNGTIPRWAAGLEASLENLYVETLSGPALVDGTIEVWLRDDPVQRETIRMGPDNLMTDWILTFETVTLGVDSAARFYGPWSHRTDSGRYFWEFVPLTNRINSRGEPYRESDPVYFAGRATLQILEQVQRKRTVDVPFTIVYHLYP